jgi:xanthine dehydrogenase accessory factor
VPGSNQRPPACRAGALPAPSQPRAFPRGRGRDRGLPAEAIERLGGIDRATYLAVLTHDPKLDDTALTVALESDPPFIGAMGSRRAQAKRRERLLAAGIPEQQLDRIAAPIGLDIGALGAEETALSIMAEVVAVRNGRAGGRLPSTSGRIHEAAGKTAAPRGRRAGMRKTTRSTRSSSAKK